MSGRILFSVAATMICMGSLVGQVSVSQADEPTIDYATQVQPVLNKYCVGCHNPDDLEGGISLASFSGLSDGLEDGPAVLAGQAKASVLFRVMAGLAEPKMPPDDLDGPTPAEIELVGNWIDAGAKAPKDFDNLRPKLIVPEIPTGISTDETPITSLAVSHATARTAIARFASVVLQESDEQTPLHTWTDFPGKVNAVSFSKSGDTLVVASGVVGLYGQADLFDTSSGEKKLSLAGHRDTLYDAQLSPDGDTLATASYDGKIMLWDVATGESKQTIAGHNGAVFDLAFNSTGKVLASASADETIKLWNVETGERLDTLSQPLAEQFAVAFSPDGQYIIGGGADSRIRVWQFVSRNERKINPLRYTRFAHEGAVTGLQFALDGQVLVSTGADRIVRAWETETFGESVILRRSPTAIHAVSVSATDDTLLLGLMDGSVAKQAVMLVGGSSEASRSSGIAKSSDISTVGESVMQVQEQEPNNHIAESQLIQAPATIQGVVCPVADSSLEDADFYRFQANAGESWIIEVNAARNKSKLDSKVEVLTAAGDRIERVVLQAVRDSYFTFRGKNSTQSDDYRVHNWQEMQLNELVYSGGEVTKLWAYPRGPDSGFNVYPGFGSRYTFLGTSAVAHALNEPAYIVEAHQPGEPLVPTGLPVFPIYYENDDDPQRLRGADSYIDFVAPADEEYLIKICDVRGFGGEDYKYELQVRRPKPDYSVDVKMDGGGVSPGSSKEVTVSVTRADGYDGGVTVDIESLPEGFQASTPIVVEAGQKRAFGVITASAEVEPPTEEALKKIRVTASATIGGSEHSKEVKWQGALKLASEPEVYVRVFSATDDKEPTWSNQSEPLELTIAPGETISALVRVKRKEGFTSRVQFGQTFAGRNLPHGVYVDNIGLNGLMIVKDSSEREFFITADSWVPETTRKFHLRTEQNGNQTSQPVILHVRK